MTEDTAEFERNLGEQPLARLMAEAGVSAKDLVASSTEQLTFKMVSRACKGRWLTTKARDKVLRAFNAATGRPHALAELFTYP